MHARIAQRLGQLLAPPHIEVAQVIESRQGLVEVDVLEGGREALFNEGGQEWRWQGAGLGGQLGQVLHQQHLEVGGRRVRDGVESIDGAQRQGGGVIVGGVGEDVIQHPAGVSGARCCQWAGTYQFMAMPSVGDGVGVSWTGSPMACVADMVVMGSLMAVMEWARRWG